MSIESFGKSHGLDISELITARKISSDNIRKIVDAVTSGDFPPFGNDLDLVVFGSLARGECTAKSDADWTILSDGQINPRFETISLEVKEEIKKTGLEDPGTSGMFGNISYSSDLIRYIGGDDDTNHNLSRRLLLLLESERIPIDQSEDSSGTAYSRVILAILDRYLKDDSAFFSDHGKEDSVPRLLLNDVVRFWRTMCVDFAFKQVEQKGKKWALRNIKLRMSRKATYLKGVLMCAAFYKRPTTQPEMRARLMGIVSTKSLDFIVEELQNNNINNELIARLLVTYNDFIKMLNNEDLRDAIERIPMADVYTHPAFLAARDNANHFQDALTEIFFKQETPLRNFTFKYALF
jgi:hypothetical protein